MRLDEIARAVEGVLAGDGALAVGALAHPRDAGAGDLALAFEKDALAALPGSAARAALVAQGTPVPANIAGHVAVKLPRYALARLSALLDRRWSPAPGVHPSAVVEASAVLGETVAVGALAWIGPDAVLGAGTIVMPQASVGAGARIGPGCVIHQGARIGEGVSLGARVVVHPNAVVGADGFSYATPQFDRAPQIAKIRSLGTVEIADDVEIGACATIDRATVAATRIGPRTRIDNLVQVAHNVTIGSDCLIAGQAGISGSVTIGDFAVLAGQAGIADHKRMGRGAIVMAASVVGTDIPDGAVFMGVPAVDRKRYLDSLIWAGRVKALSATVADLKERLRRVEAAPPDQGSKPENARP